MNVEILLVLDSCIILAAILLNGSAIFRNWAYQRFQNEQEQQQAYRPGKLRLFYYLACLSHPVLAFLPLVFIISIEQGNVTNIFSEMIKRPLWYEL